MNTAIVSATTGAVSLEERELPPYQEPSEAEIAAQRIAEIDARLTAIDLASVRALRAAVAGTATEADRDQLAVWEAEAAALRSERAGLTAVSPDA
ncbi:MAG: hypothetical protein RBR34_06115 [Rhodospirillaceae bacterium]|nr:hypothetical protein [Rhodospirillaceae bacterium]